MANPFVDDDPPTTSASVVHVEQRRSPISSNNATSSSSCERSRDGSRQLLEDKGSSYSYPEFGEEELHTLEPDHFHKRKIDTILPPPRSPYQAVLEENDKDQHPKVGKNEITSNKKRVLANKVVVEVAQNGETTFVHKSMHAIPVDPIVLMKTREEDSPPLSKEKKKRKSKEQKQRIMVDPWKVDPGNKS